MLTVMPCARSHSVHAIASSSDAGCLSRVMVPRFHPWRRANWGGRVMLRGEGESADSVRAMASRVLTGTFAAQDCASVRKEVSEILALRLAVVACAKQVVPATE